MGGEIALCCVVNSYVVVGFRAVSGSLSVRFWRIMEELDNTINDATEAQTGGPDHRLNSSYSLFIIYFLLLRGPPIFGNLSGSFNFAT
jgi:hypothetical protein